MFSVKYFTNFQCHFGQCQGHFGYFQNILVKCKKHFGYCQKYKKHKKFWLKT